MTKEVMKLEGLKELDEALKELPKATGKNVLRRALTAAAEPIAAQAIQAVPVKTGRLKKSIGVSRVKFSSGDAGKRAFAAAMRAGASRAEAREAAISANEGGSNITSALVLVGPGRLRAAGMQEFGTVKNAPHPYLRPAWDSNRFNAAEIIKTELANEIQKAADRLARKQARLLAKT